MSATRYNIPVLDVLDTDEEEIEEHYILNNVVLDNEAVKAIGWCVSEERM